MKKKLLSILLVVSMLCSIVPTALAAEATLPVPDENGTITIVENGTYKLPDFSDGKIVTIKAEEGVEAVFDNIGTKNMGSASVTFENVTFNHSNGTYTGLQHSGDLTYINCTINGQPFLYGTSETFDGCTFNQESADAYNVWTYGAQKVVFNNCTFNSAGKSVLVYNEGACATELTVINTEFNASAPVEGKAAIEIDTSSPNNPGAMDGTTITIDDATTANGFGIGSVSGNSLWNDKKNLTNLTVTVAGEKVWPIAPAVIDGVEYDSLAKAVEAADGSAPIILQKDVALGTGNVTVDGKTLTLDLNGYTLTGSGCDGVIYAINRADVTIDATNGGAVVANQCDCADGGYTMAVFAKDGGHITINGGEYSNKCTSGSTDHDLIYANNGSIDVYGGTFQSCVPSRTLNAKDNTKAIITVYGGSFYDFDPSNEQTAPADAPEVSVADGYISVKSGVYYEVIEAPTEIPEKVENVTVKPEASEVTISEDVEVSDDVKKALESVEISDTDSEVITDAVWDTVANATETVAAELEVDVSQIESVSVEASIQVEVVEVDTENKTLVLDITPVVKTMATVQGETEAREVSSTPIETTGTKVTVTIPLPAGFADDGDEVTIVHTTKNGEKIYHNETVKDNAVSFDNEDGFSEFRVIPGTYTGSYVSLGASNTNGYGIRGYLPEAVTEDPLAADKSKLNVYGYNRAPKEAYPYQVADYYDLELTQLAISSMRVEELRYLLDDTYEGDAYMDWRFTGGQNWFEIAEPGGVSVLREAYRDALTNANVISMDIGWNNFGVYAFNNIKTILADGDYWKAPDFTQVMDVNEVIEYEALKAYVMELLTAEAGTIDAELQDKLVKMADVLVYATIGACYHFDIVMDEIYALNDDAQVVVVNIQNLAEGLSVEFEGVELPLGDIYGELIHMVNVYRAAFSPYADTFFVANVAEDGTATTFLDEIQAWNGNPESLSPNMKDCFDMYDDNLYIRSIIEYMMVGQGLSELFAGFRETAAGYGIDLFEEPQYTFSMPAIDLGTLNLKNPPDALNAYIFKVAPHLKNIRNNKLDAYDAEFSTIPAPLKTEFDAKLQKLHDAYKYTLNYAYDVVATVVQEAAKINTIEVDADSLNGFNSTADGFVGYIFGEIITGAEANFKHALGQGASYTFEMDENLFADPATAAIAVLATRYELGNSFFAHPNEEGHDQITDAIVNALDQKYTGNEFAEDSVTEAIETAIYLITEYYDDAYAYAYDYADQAGYIKAATDAIDGVIAEVESIDVIGTNAFKAEVKVEVEKIVETLEAAKTLLEEADLLDQNTLDALMGLLSEAADAILHLEHLVVQASVDVNQEAIIPALKAAHKALIEVVIPQIDKQLQLAVKAGAEWLADKLEEAANDLVEAMIKALPGVDQALYNWLYENPDKVIAFFTEYGDEMIAFAEEYSEDALLVLAYIAFTYGEDAVDYIVDHPEETLKQLVGWYDQYGYRVWPMVDKYLETLGIYEGFQSVTGKAQEAADKLVEILNNYGEELYQELSKIAADTMKQIETLKGQLAELQKQLENALESEKAGILAQIADIQAKLDALYGELYNKLMKAAADIDAALPGMIQEAYDALVDALVAVAEEYGHDVAVWLYNWLYDHPAEVIGFFNEYGDDILAFFEEYLEETMMALGYLVLTFGDDVAEYVMNNADEILANIAKWFKIHGVLAADLLMVYLKELGVIDALKDVAGQLTAKALELLNGIKDMVDEQLNIIENLKAKLESMKAELENKLENLKAELESKLEELKNASAEVKAEIEKAIAEIEAAIEAVEKAIAEIDAKIAKLVQFVRDVNSAVEDLIAAIEMFAENAPGAVKAVATALKDLTDAISAMQEFVADLSATIDSLQDIMNDVPLALEELSKLAADVAAAFDAIIEACKNALFDATHGEYDVNCQSYYVSLGDSTVTGYGADFGENPDGYGEHGFKTLVPNSFPYMLAEKLGLDLETTETAEMQYIQLAMAGLRTNDLLYILDETRTPDDYFYKRSLPQYISVYGGGLDAMREDYKSELAKADLVTISIGNCNFTGVQETGIIAKWINNDEGLNVWMNNPYFGDAIKGAIIDLGIDLNAPAYATDWDSYLSEDEPAEMYEVIEEIKEAMVENGLPEELSIDVGEMLEMPLEPGTIVVTVPVADLMGQFIEWYAYCYASHAFNYNDLLNKIHEMTRPGAEIVIVGMFNPMDELVITYEGKEIPVGEYIDYALSAVNLTSFSYALMHPNTTYISVPDVESVADYDMAQNGNVFELMDFVKKYTAEVHGNFTDHHETVAGHEYIADRIYNALTVTNTAHVWNDGVVTKAANCTEPGEKLYTCDACGETKTEAIDIDPSAHAWGQWTSVDNSNHNRVCAHNAAHVQTSAHTDANSDNICDVCGGAFSSGSGGGSGFGGGGSAVTKPVNPFTDVHEDEYWYDAVLWAVEKGITNGITPTTFAPTEPCTRGQMVTFLWRSAGSPAPKTTVCPFTDVDKDAYFYDAVLWAVENGVTKGVTETTFEPYTTCSRAHMVTFICRFADGEPVGDSNDFIDVPENVYYTDTVQWALETGVTNGTTATTFSPSNPCTRGQMVTFLYRHFEK